MKSKQVDWAKIHRKLSLAGAALEAGWTPGREKVQEILERRARFLAREAAVPRTEYHLNIVEFLLEKEYFGLEAHYIKEVVPLREYTPLPGVPPFVLGLVNVRGQVFSVVDLKTFFNMPGGRISGLTRVILLNCPGMKFGILADEMLGVHEVCSGDLSRFELPSHGVEYAFIKAVTKERLVILDADRILTDKRIIINDNNPHGPYAHNKQ